MHYIASVSLIFFVFLCDQLSKIFVLKSAHLWPQDLTPFLAFDLVWNKGISFGLFSRSSEAGRQLIAVGIVAAMLYLCYLLYRTRVPLYRMALSLTLGGALGNLTDRLYRGAVVDFLDFHVGSFHWPAFNLADAAICVGISLFLWLQMKGKAL